MLRRTTVKAHFVPDAENACDEASRPEKSYQKQQLDDCRKIRDSAVGALMRDD
jgi:hypothetical protein